MGAAELHSLDGRDLTTLDSNWLSADHVGSLEGGNAKSKKNSNTSWDQFEVNKRLYNVNSTFDENLYTKKLNKSELTKEQIRKADKYAREIEGTRSSNIHLQEERGQVMERELDEEDLYSGVRRPGSSNVPGKNSPSTGASSSNWRRAVTGEASPPTNMVRGQGQKSTSVVSSNTQIPGKGNKQSARGTKSSGHNDSPPPGYEDDYIPVSARTPESGKSSVSPSMRPKTPEPVASESLTTEKKTESSPQISFYGEPDKPPIPPIENKNAKGPAEAEKKTILGSATTLGSMDPEKSKPVQSKLNPNATEFKFNVNAKEFSPTVSSASTNPGGGRYNNRRFDNNAADGPPSYPNQPGYGGYDIYGAPMQQQQWEYGAPGMMMYGNPPVMMGAPNGPIVPPVGDMPMYPQHAYGGDQMYGGNQMIGSWHGSSYGPGGPYNPVGRGGGRGGFNHSGRGHSASSHHEMRGPGDEASSSGIR